MDRTPGGSESLVLTTVTELPVAPRSKGVLLRNPSTFTGPGKTLHELYSALGSTAEKHANRAAHSLGLGPAAAAERIRAFFGDKHHRESALKELRDPKSIKLEKDCTKLMKYARPSESSRTQFDAFGTIVELTTQFPGIRLLFLRSEYAMRTGASEDAIASFWDRPTEHCGTEWDFRRKFASACLADEDLSAMLEETPPHILGYVGNQNEGLSIIERLIVASDCEGKSQFSAQIAIRYLGGILELPSFWLQTGPIYQAIVQKLLLRVSILLKDLGIDSEVFDDPAIDIVSDRDGVDRLCEALLNGVLRWKTGTSRTISQEYWYPGLRPVLHLLRQPKTEDLLPKAWAQAQSETLRIMVYSEYKSQVVNSLTIELLPQELSSKMPFHAATQADKTNKNLIASSAGRNLPPKSMTSKILLLGSSDSGKSTILKQLRLIYDAPFSSHETEIYRQLVFSNLMRELRFVLDSLAGMDFALPDALLPQARLLEENHDLRDNDRFPERYLSPLTSLWNNPVIQSAVIRGNEIALEENMQYFFSSLPRLFLPSYVPSHQDILHGRARTTGIVETIFKAKELEMLVVDVGGTKSERRKWIHCFNDVTVIMFVVSLSGYDKRLIEDFDDNQMRDSMLIWDSITASRWFNEQTTFILCLNKNDLFERKVPVSDIKDFFPEFNGEPGDALSGRDYFKARFRHLAEKNGRSIYIHVITATDTVAMRALMAGVEAILRSNLQGVAPI